MLTLNEIRNVNFRKANFGGYRAEDVEAFIDEVQLSYDTLLRENAELVKKLEVLAAKLEEYQGEEDSIRNALMNAQKVGDASLRDAKHKAEIILKDATIKAEKIVQNAQGEIHNEREVIERMQRDIAEFKAKLLRIYKEHLTLINNIPNEEIMRPETREMVDSIQMLDRRATEPAYDRPGQNDSRPARMQPTREYAELPPDRPAAPQGAGRDSVPPAFSGGDAVVREDVRKRQESVQAPAPVMPAPERTDKRKDGFTVSIGGDFADGDSRQSAPPAVPAARRGFGAAPQQNGNFGAAPQQNGNFGAAPQQGGNFGAAPQQGGGYGAPQQGGNYGAPQQNGGFGAPSQNGGFGAPSQNGGFDDMGRQPQFQTMSSGQGGMPAGQPEPESGATSPASLFKRRKQQQ